MSSLRTLRHKIKSIRATKQITQAMKLVATAKLHRSQTNIISARPYALKMNELINDLLERIESPSGLILEYIENIKKNGEDVKKRPCLAILLITADRGLCGSFNTNLISECLEFMELNKNKKIYLFVVGRKGYDYFRKTKINLKNEYINILNRLSFVHAEMIYKDIVEFYLKEKPQNITAIFAEFQSIVHQKVVKQQIIPFKLDDISISQPHGFKQKNKIDFLYEPKKEQILEMLIPRYIKAQIYRILLESCASEHASRMMSMDQATKNAIEIIDSLTLEMNKLRQASITREISDIVGTSEAIA